MKKRSRSSWIIPGLFALMLSYIGSGVTCGQREKNVKEEPVLAEEPKVIEEYPGFPWPPPRASATSLLPPEWLRKSTDEIIYLHNVEQKIHAALEACGYFEISYYAAPNGFAMVTRLEQIEHDGAPKEMPDRWATEVRPLRRFSLIEYLRALFTANPGYYRIIVFIVTSHPFSQTDTLITRNEVVVWLSEGLNILPRTIGMREYSKDHTCTALIYEFKQSEFQKEAEIMMPSRFAGKTHLEKAKLWNELKK